MKKYLIILLIVVGLGFSIYKYFSGDNLSNDRAERDKNGRYITVINETKQVINKVYVTVNGGTEIEKMKREDIDINRTSFSIEIPKEYSEYNTFTVILVDRYDTQYKKTINNVSAKGRTEVKISKDDVVEETNSLKTKIDRFFNGD